MNITTLHRTVRLTARSSGLLFAGAQATSAMGPSGARLSRPLYAAFMAAHAVHFAAVARYAVATDGRGMFPGGRSRQDVGGWPTVLGIYTIFAGLALAGRPTAAPTPSGPPTLRRSARVARGIIAAMFVGTYLGQSTRSGWYSVPATAIAAATVAGLLTRTRTATTDERSRWSTAPR